MPEPAPDDSPTIPIETPPWSRLPDLHLGWDLDGDGDIEGIETKVPEPAVVRGVIATVVPLAGLIVGKTLDLAWVDPALAVYAVVVPLALGLLIRRKVTPVRR